MKFRNLKRRALNESGELNYMQLIERVIAKHRRKLDEAWDDEEDNTDGLDEFSSDDDMDLDDEDINVDDDIDMDEDMGGEDDMVTITVPRSVAEELMGAAEEAVGDISDEDLISDEDVAEADANIAAEDAADAALEAEDAAEEIAEEDEEAFAVTGGGAPTRTRFTGSYKNEPTVPSIIKGAIAKHGYAKTVTDGSPKRTQFTGSYRNEPTVKSRYTPGKTRFLQNTID